MHAHTLNYSAKAMQCGANVIWAHSKRPYPMEESSAEPGIRQKVTRAYVEHMLRKYRACERFIMVYDPTHFGSWKPAADAAVDPFVPIMTPDMNKCMYAHRTRAYHAPPRRTRSSICTKRSTKHQAQQSAMRCREYVEGNRCTKVINAQIPPNQRHKS